MMRSLWQNGSIAGVFIVAMALPAVARAEIANVQGTANSQSEACAAAKKSATSIYGKRIIRWETCQCSDRGSSGRYDFRDRYHCTVDVHLKD